MSKFSFYLHLIMLIVLIGCKEQILIFKSTPPASIESASEENDPISIIITYWARQLGLETYGGNNGREECNAIAVDDDGSTYCAGFTDFDNYDTSPGATDIIIVKYDRDGNFVKGFQVGDNAEGANGVIDASSAESCEALTYDNGFIYCTGYTKSNLFETSGGGGNEDFFVLKLSKNLDIVWGRQLGSTTLPGVKSADKDIAQSIAIAGDGSIYLCGKTRSDMADTNIGGSWDIAIAKLDASGVYQWSYQAGTSKSYWASTDGSGDDEIRHCLTDASGNLYAVGAAESALADPYGGNDDILYLSLDQSGTLRWIKQLGTASAPIGAATDNSDEAFSAVISGTNLIFGGGSSSDFAEVRSGGEDFFLVKASLSDGSIVNHIQLGQTSLPSGTLRDRIVSIDVDSNTGDIWALGSSFSVLDADSSANIDLVLLRFNSSLTLESMKVISSSDDIFPSAIKVDSAGSVYLGGHLSQADLYETSGTDYDFFLIKTNSSYEGI